MTAIDSAAQSCPSDEEAPAGAGEQTHIVKVKILSDSGSPLANIALTIILPDGAIEEATTDENGIIELNGVPPGNCKIESDWKTLTVDQTVFYRG